MAYDAYFKLFTLTTATASSTGSAVNTVTGSPTRGYKSRFLITSGLVATTGTAASTVVPSIQVSADSTTWRTAYTGPTATLTATAAATEYEIPFFNAKAEPYVRGIMTYTAAGATGPSIIFKWDIGDHRATPL